MIPGDIDLTEKLDFRKVVKRNIPQLPDTWKKSKINLSNDSIITITSNSANYTVRNQYRLDAYDAITYTFSSSSSSYDYHFCNDFYNGQRATVSYSNQICYYTSSFSSSSSTKILVSIDEDEYDVFGNKKIIPKEIPKIPWNKYDNSYNSIDKIPWLTHNNKYTFRNYYNEYIPWEYYTGITYNHIDLSSDFNRAKNLITWLLDKTSTFIMNYFESEDDNSSLQYLTNMSWIRVKDAIVD